MSFADKENSVESGSPIELIDIVIGATTYHMTTGSEVVTYTNVYTPTTIQRDTITLGPDQRTEILSVVMPSDHPFPQSYATVVPGLRATMTIRRVHRSDGDSEIITLFKGVVRSVSFSDQGGTSRIGVMPISGALSRPIPRYTFQSLCNHVLGDSWCQIDLDGDDPDGFPYTHTGTASGTDGNLIVVGGIVSAGYPDGYFTGGFMIADGDYRLVLRQTGNNIKLLLPFNDNEDSESVQIVAGCDHSLATCASSKFENVINYGGFPFVPTKNPFATGL